MVRVRVHQVSAALRQGEEWNVNCLLSGRKRWFFLNAFEANEKLQWARGHKFRPNDPLNNDWTDWVYLDPDHVDLIVQNQLREMDYYELIQEPGDCVFIPFAMLHAVTKLDEGLQFAASWMFLPETVYDEQACEHAPLQADLPLGAMDALYAYTGRGLIPQGYVDPIFFVRRLAELMRFRGEQHLSHRTFYEAVTGGASILAQLGDSAKRVKDLYELLTSFAQDPRSGLAMDELLSRVPMRLWCKPAAEGDPEGALPCDIGMEYELADQNTVDLMEENVQHALKPLGVVGQLPKARKKEFVFQRAWRPHAALHSGPPAAGRTEL